MTYFAESLRRAKSYLLFIPFLALNETLIRSESTRIYALLLNTLAFILYAIVYGSMIEEISFDTKSEWSHLLKVHILKFIGATFILYIPVFATSFLNSEEHYLRIFVFKALVGLAIQCSTLYVMPLVFLKRQVLPSFSEGFRYLAHHIQKSSWLIFLVLFAFVLKYFVAFANTYYLDTAHSLVHYSIKYAHDLLSTFIGLVLFSMASSILIKSDNGPSLREAKQSDLA